jgi:plasmid maintenance system killer protein
MGYVRQLAKDDLEQAKIDIGIKKTVDKKMLKRQQKEEQRKRSPEKKSLFALRKFINKLLNVFINNQWTIHFDGKTIKVLDTSLKLEHTFMHIASTPLFHQFGFLSKWMDVFKAEDRFSKKIDIKNIRRGYWGATDVYLDQLNGYGRAEYNMAEGGFVDVDEATYRKFDMIPSLICRNEFVFTQEATRGAGRGSYIAGAYFLTMLMDHYEKEATKYGHRR